MFVGEINGDLKKHFVTHLWRNGHLSKECLTIYNPKWGRENNLEPPLFFHCRTSLWEELRASSPPHDEKRFLGGQEGRDEKADEICLDLLQCSGDT